ncbi:MAG: ABC transporter substrate-binding protein [Trueperaceae bacterium]|nr:ABC transporter substrate-binding protein [Trueperaceae bacterium]
MITSTLRRILLALGVVGLLGSAVAQDLVFPIGEDDRFDWASLERFEALDLTGQTIEVFGPWLTVDEELVNSVFAYFEHATGAEIEYAGSDSFEQQIVIDVQAGSPPDLAVFPQPGLAADLASQGALEPLGASLEQWTRENYAAGDSWVDLGTYAGEDGEEDFYGFFYKVDVKSLVWYSPDNFADAGYEIPETMEELIALSDQIVADGGTPWCIGLGSGDATGWPATDWVEDIMLRTQEPSVYDQWVEHAIPFDDPRVVNAIQTFGSFAKNDAWVQGGAQGVASTDFRDSPQGLFDVPPGCYMHRQASFIPSFFPEDAELGLDVDFFYFPPFEAEDLGRPVLGAGTVWGMTDENPAARELLDFLTTPLAHEIWMAQSGFLTPHSGVNLDAYANDTLRGQGEILRNATTFRFDASDLMPGAIGAGAFWTGMVDYVGGESAEEAAAGIEEAWQSLE